MGQNAVMGSASTGCCNVVDVCEFALENKDEGKVCAFICWRVFRVTRTQYTVRGVENLDNVRSFIMKRRTDKVVLRLDFEI